MPQLFKSNQLVCERCGSNCLGYICPSCGTMICSCESCPVCMDIEEDEFERQRAMERERDIFEEDMDRKYGRY